MPRLFALFFGSVVRWGCNVIAGYLIAKGVLTPSAGDDLVYGLVASIPPLLWALWQKYKSRLHFLTALELPANASEADVKDILDNSTQREKLAFVTRKSVSQLLLFLCLLPLLLLSQACPLAPNPQEAARSAEEKFAAYTDRIAEHIGRGMKTTELLVDLQTITPARGTAITDVLLSFNAGNKELIVAAKKFIVVEDGKRILRFTENGRLELERLADALSTSATNLLSNPAILRIDPKARSQLLTLIKPAEAAAKSLARLIRQAKNFTVPGTTIEIELDNGSSTQNRSDHRLLLTAMGRGDTRGARPHRIEWAGTAGFGALAYRGQ